MTALYRGWRKTQNSDTSLNQTELYLAIIYLRYLAENLSLPKLLLEAGALSDRVNFDNPSCEAFYELMNDNEKGENSLPFDLENFDERVGNLFSDYA